MNTLLARGTKFGYSYKIINSRFCSSIKSFIEYKCGSPERVLLEDALDEIVMNENTVPIVIGNEKFPSGDQQKQRMPHNHQQVITKFYFSNRQHIEKSIRKALEMQQSWSNVPAAQRANIWRKCADIIANDDRHLLNASIMLSQAKTYLQAEEDTFRLIGTLYANADFLEQLDQIKISNNSSNKKMIYPSICMRPLDGFVAAIGPGTMTWVSANMAFCPALMGNCVLWKPSSQCIISSYIVFQAMEKAGLPKGVIYFLPCNKKLFLDCICRSKYLAGINYTGHIDNFRAIWNELTVNLYNFKSFPRLVGECGGKNFHFIHESANIDLALEATKQAAFQFSGQHCTSCSRLYVPKNLWPTFSTALQETVSALKVGDPSDYNCFMSAVISEPNFDKILKSLNHAHKSTSMDIICGGDYCKTLGYYIEPTVLHCQNPWDNLMREEIVGPVLCVFVYDNKTADEVFDLIANTTNYAYTGSIFASDDKVICHALKKLRMTAANIYINEKCTGTLASLMPFGGNRLSSTNDKPGSAYFLLRWSSPQLIEEVFPSEKHAFF